MKVAGQNTLQFTFDSPQPLFSLALAAGSNGANAGFYANKQADE